MAREVLLLTALMYQVSLKRQKPLNLMALSVRGGATRRSTPQLRQPDCRLPAREGEVAQSGGPHNLQIVGSARHPDCCDFVRTVISFRLLVVAPCGKTAADCAIMCA